MKRHIFTGTLILAVTTMTAGAQQIARDSRATAPAAVSGTATLSGALLTDDRIPQEVKRARVDLMADGVPPQTAYTDDHGRFVFSRLPAARYTLSATKPGYVRAAFGARRPDRPGTPITVTEGQQLTAIQLKMARGAVITGTVHDEQGQPAPGATVRVLQYRMQNGERTLMPPLVGGNGFGETTDDRGSYRIFGLAAGEYIVSASPRPVGGSDIRQMTAAEIQAAQQAIQQRTVSAAQAGNASSRPQPLTVTYATVYYPGTTTPTSAVPITVAAGEERAGVDLALQLVRTSRVEGIVSVPNGIPVQAVSLVMLPAGGLTAGPAMISFNRVTPGPDGKFVYNGIAPGQYTISARVGGGGGGLMTLDTMGGGGGFSTSSAGGGNAGRGRDAIGTYWAQADVNVDGEPVSGISLNLQPGMAVSGQIAIDANGVDTPDDLSKARISLVPAGSGTVTVSVSVGPGTVVDKSGRFTINDVTPGKYRISGSLSTPEANWTLKSAIINGKESLDFPVEIGANDKSLDAVVTFTNQTQDVSGTLQDATGRPAPDYTVVVFPADKSYWPAATRRIRTARPGTDGKFLFRGLPTGAYRIAALVDIAQGEANDPSFLEQLVPASIPFTLAAGENKTQDIKIAGGN